MTCREEGEGGGFNVGSSVRELVSSKVQLFVFVFTFVQGISRERSLAVWLVGSLMILQ